MLKYLIVKKIIVITLNNIRSFVNKNFMLGNSFYGFNYILKKPISYFTGRIIDEYFNNHKSK